jgi:hypothetical protein
MANGAAPVPYSRIPCRLKPLRVQSHALGVPVALEPILIILASASQYRPSPLE